MHVFTFTCIERFIDRCSSGSPVDCRKGIHYEGAPVVKHAGTSSLRPGVRGLYFKVLSGALFVLFVKETWPFVQGSGGISYFSGRPSKFDKFPSPGPAGSSRARTAVIFLSFSIYARRTSHPTALSFACGGFSCFTFPLFLCPLCRRPERIYMRVFPAQRPPEHFLRTS